jgi:8-oxo-dGTP pyrophosphatase MutT (NUDIX family)
MASSPPVVPRPAASVVIVRGAAATAPEPIEVWMIRRKKTMKFLGGYYAFPGGRVDAADGAAEALACVRGLDVAGAERVFPDHGELPALAFWITAVRELLEESGLLLACDAGGQPIDGRRPTTLGTIVRLRKELMAGGSLPALLAREGWCCDLRGLRYLSHFITPASSPIRFTARFFLCRVPDEQAPALFTEETSEAFWIHPGEGYRRFIADEMAMAEPAEYGLGYLAQFKSVDELWAAHADGKHKFHGVSDRIDAAWKDFDWKANRFAGGPPRGYPPASRAT